MKVVKVRGKYAVRRFSFFYLRYVYLDLRSPSLWWSKDNCFFSDCLTDSVDFALSIAKPDQIIKGKD